MRPLADVTRHDVSNKMPFAVDDKHVIKVLHQEKRYSSQRFLKEFPDKVGHVTVE